MTPYLQPPCILVTPCPMPVLHAYALRLDISPTMAPLQLCWCHPPCIAPPPCLDCPPLLGPRICPGHRAYAFRPPSSPSHASGMCHPHHMYTPAPLSFQPRAYATSVYQTMQPHAHQLHRPTLACQCTVLPTCASQPPRCASQPPRCTSQPSRCPAPLGRPVPWPPLCFLWQTAPSTCALCSDGLPLATCGRPRVSGPAWSTPTCPMCFPPMLTCIPLASHMDHLLQLT